MVKKGVVAKVVGTPSDMSPDKINGEYNSTLHDAKDKVYGHKVFKDVRADKPRGIGAGGHSAAFDKKGFRDSMEGSSKYEAACNLGWLNEKFSTLPGVPYNKRLVDNYVQTHFSTPTAFPFPIIVACPDGQTYDPMKHIGALEFCVPEELVHAFFYAVARDIDNDNVKVDVIKQWYHIAVTTTFSFEILGSANQIYYRTLDKSQSICQQYQTLTRTCVQRIFEIVRFKQHLESARKRALTMSEVITEYRTNTNLFDGVTIVGKEGENISDDFFAKANTVYTKLLSHEAVRNVIMWAEGLLLDLEFLGLVWFC